MNPDDPETLVVSLEEVGLRLDKFLALRFPEYSRQYFQHLIEQKLVLVNGEQEKKRTFLSEGDEIEIEFALTPEIAVTPENIPLDILYEDDDLLVINKPPGLVVHPAVGNWSGTFVNALLYHCRQLSPEHSLRPGIVHRLDKETSGVLCAAKNEKAQQKLVEAFAQRKVHKTYLAICIGKPGDRTITGKIGRHPTKRKEMALLTDKGKESTTHCKTLAYNEKLSVVRLIPETGRTHQLRVHMKHVGSPILGDTVYGNAQFNERAGTSRQLLHAFILQFPHPITGKMVEVKAPLPDDMKKFIMQITKNENFDPTR